MTINHNLAVPGWKHIYVYIDIYIHIYISIYSALCLSMSWSCVATEHPQAKSSTTDKTTGCIDQLYMHYLVQCWPNSVTSLGQHQLNKRRTRVMRGQSSYMVIKFMWPKCCNMISHGTCKSFKHTTSRGHSAQYWIKSMYIILEARKKVIILEARKIWVYMYPSTPKKYANVVSHTKEVCYGMTYPMR